GRSKGGPKDNLQAEQDRESSRMRNQSAEEAPPSLPPLTAIPEPDAPRPSESGVKPRQATSQDGAAIRVRRTGSTSEPGSSSSPPSKQGLGVSGSSPRETPGLPDLDAPLEPSRN